MATTATAADRDARLAAVKNQIAQLESQLSAKLALAREQEEAAAAEAAAAEAAAAEAAAAEAAAAEAAAADAAAAEAAAAASAPGAKAQAPQVLASPSTDRTVAAGNTTTATSSVDAPPTTTEPPPSAARADPTPPPSTTTQASEPPSTPSTASVEQPPAVASPPPAATVAARTPTTAPAPAPPVAAPAPPSAPVATAPAAQPSPTLSALTPAATAGMTPQQQALIEQSGKMLQFLRNEVLELRANNERLLDTNRRLEEANATAGSSFLSLKEHFNTTTTQFQEQIDQLKQTNQQLQIQILESKEELKMKNATYIAEVHTRLRYQKCLNKVVDLVQTRVRDSKLVDQILLMSDQCEAGEDDGY